MSRDLALRSEDDLIALFDSRSDLLADPPRSFTDLAARLSSTPGARAAIMRLDLWSRDVLETVAFCEGALPSDELAAVMAHGHADPPSDLDAHVERAVTTLRNAGLVWLDGNQRVRPVEPVRLAIQRPFGFGRSVRTLAAPRSRDELLRIAREIGVAPGPGERTSKDDLVERIAAAFDSPERTVLLLDGAPRGTVELFAEALVNGGVRVPYTYGFSPAARHRRPDLDWLLDRGLIMRANYDFAEVPREVALAHRDRLLGRLQPLPPPADAGALAVDPHARDIAAATAATAIVSLVESLCSMWGDQPPTTLRSTGGIGAREFKKVAKELNIDEQDVPFCIELAAAAGLLTFESDRHDELVMPTPAFDDWRAQPLAARWEHLVDAWRNAPRWLSLGGQRADDGKLIPALAGIASAHTARTQRERVLTTLASLPNGHAPAADALAAHVSWFSAGSWAGPAPVDVLVEWFLVEAERLGVTGHGAYVAKSAEELLGAASAEVTLQADLTAITTGPLVPELSALLDDAADVESSGAATVWRFSDASIRRALDAGRSAESMLDALSAAASKGLPQPLQYLITDIARRHGLLRVGAVASYVTAEDPALLAAAVRAKGAAKIGLRLVGPTVAVATVPPAKVLEVLRAAGHAPIEVDEHGGVVMRGRGTRRATDPLPDRVVVPMRTKRATTSGSVSAVDVVRALRAAPMPQDGPV